MIAGAVFFEDEVVNPEVPETRRVMPKPEMRADAPRQEESSLTLCSRGPYFRGP